MHTTFTRTILVLICSIVLYTCTYSQARVQDIRVQVGHSFIGEDFPAMQVYDLWLVAVSSSLKLASLGRLVDINSLLEAQFGDATTVTGGSHDFDLALTISAEFLWQFHRSVGFRFALGTGPGYQSSESNKQARGFVFSNNVSAGLRFVLAKEAFILSPQVRFRHLSNAGLESPNLGIDNFLFLIGVAVPLVN